MAKEDFSFPIAFDGHNDVLSRLYRAGGVKAAPTFLSGRDGHIDLPKSKTGGFWWRILCDLCSLGASAASLAGICPGKRLNSEALSVRVATHGRNAPLINRISRQEISRSLQQGN